MSILVTGLNSALQKRFHTEKIKPGNVHRANFIEYDIGGKGQNCITTLSHLTSTSPSRESNKNDYTTAPIHLIQFVGKGENGNKLLKMLDKKKEGNKNIDFLTVRSDSETRLSTTIISDDIDDDATEFVDPSGIVTEKDIVSLLNLMKNNNNNDYNGILFMGSLPTDCPTTIYSSILQLCADYSNNKRENSKNKIIVIDTVHGLKLLFQTIRKINNSDNNNINDINISAMLKINMAELFRLLEIEGKENETEKMDDHSVLLLLHKAAQKFYHCYLSNENKNTNNVSLAITDGKHAAHFIQYNVNNNDYKKKWNIDENANYNIYRIQIPNIKEYNDDTTLLYPIGAGDAVAASTIAAWHDLEYYDPNNSFLNNNILDIQNYHSLLFNKDIKVCKDEKMLKAFMFGLACGSASCLQSKNSALDNIDVKALFLQTIKHSDSVIRIA